MFQNSQDEAITRLWADFVSDPIWAIEYIPIRMPAFITFGETDGLDWDNQLMWNVFFVGTYHKGRFFKIPCS